MSEPLARLSFRSAGESHGPAVMVTLEGVPRGLELDVAAIDATLRLRQGGAGRGGRQRIEDDHVEILAGVRQGRTIGSPLCFRIPNRDHKIDELPEPVRPRPGHADLAGCYHWLDHDIRSTLERSSARETAARVAAGAVCRQLLAVAGTAVLGYVRECETVSLPDDLPGESADIEALRAQRDASRLYTVDAATDAAMLERVQEAAKDRDTVGGIVEVVVRDPVPGIGTCVQWHERLEARLGAALLSIPAIKGVEIGLGMAAGRRRGSAVHDSILPAATGLGGVAHGRGSNRAGGIEGGMTNGQAVVVRAAMKPISTLRQPLASVDLTTDAAAAAGYERSDVCAVSACAIVAEAMVALVVADATLQRIGGESVAEFEARLQAFLAAARALRPPAEG
ncbi:MAG: chorismate synthase [bacterium]|nr:chorismate synthase [bacterium]